MNLASNENAWVVVIPVTLTNFETFKRVAMSIGSKIKSDLLDDSKLRLTFCVTVKADKPCTKSFWFHKLIFLESIPLECNFRTNFWLTYLQISIGSMSPWEGIFYLLNSTSINSPPKIETLTIEGFLIVISSSKSLLWYWSFPSVQPLWQLNLEKLQS